MTKTLTIATLNLKGGCAKTSTILNLGGVLQEHGRKPLLVDLDPQRSATQWATQGGDRFPFPVAPIEVPKNAKTFKTRLDQLVGEHVADTILFDTPPQMEAEALLAALLSDIVLIPITPSPLDIWAGEKAINTVREARQERKGLPKIALVPSRLVSKSVLAKEISGTLRQFNEPVSPSISMRVVMAEACVAGLPINLYAPGSPSHVEFKNLMKFILTNVKK